MPKNWSLYLEQLREVDDNLYNQKEQFKMGLLKSVPKAKKEIQSDQSEASEEEKIFEEPEKCEAEVQEKVEIVEEPEKTDEIEEV